MAIGAGLAFLVFGPPPAGEAVAARLMPLALLAVSVSLPFELGLETLLARPFAAAAAALPAPRRDPPSPMHPLRWLAYRGAAIWREQTRHSCKPSSFLVGDGLAPLAGAGPSKPLASAPYPAACAPAARDRRSAARRCSSMATSSTSSRKISLAKLAAIDARLL
ncbi:uncharacterized protein RHOBADRAFT_64672 [Rhodotorula graminis WP1]|uniref:Uncharacterized protein n=1 Tax=Rhodotorula graminis (strain WP1) TaxID=578459 RepID=A0A194S8W8_RHOGW|nr:uncharacterized protein RHOBADRAFT_64672 [Rhodotorula graminis WP1]KPV77173.1 hypothetical protein RHOBADRAFT_64672 [Rhodotorula graminis WP1]